MAPSKSVQKGQSGARTFVTEESTSTTIALGSPSPRCRFAWNHRTREEVPLGTCGEGRRWARARGRRGRLFLVGCSPSFCGLGTLSRARGATMQRDRPYAPRAGATLSRSACSMPPGAEACACVAAPPLCSALLTKKQRTGACAALPAPCAQPHAHASGTLEERTPRIRLLRGRGAVRARRRRATASSACSKGAARTSAAGAARPPRAARAARAGRRT